MKKILEKYSEKPSDLFVRIFTLYLFGYLPFMLLQVTLNGLNIMPVNIDEEQVYGWKGALVLIGFYPFIVVIFTVMTWINFMVGFALMKLLKKIFYA